MERLRTCTWMSDQCGSSSASDKLCDLPSDLASLDLNFLISKMGMMVVTAPRDLKDEVCRGQSVWCLTRGRISVRALQGR